MLREVPPFFVMDFLDLPGITVEVQNKSKEEQRIDEAYKNDKFYVADYTENILSSGFPSNIDEYRYQPLDKEVRRYKKLIQKFNKYFKNKGIHFTNNEKRFAKDSLISKYCCNGICDFIFGSKAQ